MFDKDWSVWSRTDIQMIECIEWIGLAKVLWCDFEGRQNMVRKVGDRWEGSLQ